MLHRGGYPFRANDLTVEEWQSVGEMKETLENMKGVWHG